MLTAEGLRLLLDYDPATGIFRWKVRRNGVRNDGVAGTVHAKKGYRQIQIDGRIYRAHRLAWLYVYGCWPPGILDHETHDPDDNRISKLRVATWEQNQRNSKRRKNNQSGFKGVIRARGKWLASITIDKRKVRLGLFDTPEEAHAAYCEALIKQAGAFARFE